jgi:hypothetical protein
MLSRNAYVFGSFVIPEGAGPGDPRIEFDVENGAIRMYDNTGMLIASMAADFGSDGTYDWIPGLAAYSSDFISVITSISGGALRFTGTPTNPFVLDGGVDCDNPKVAFPQYSASVTLKAPSTNTGSNDGRARITLKSTSKDGSALGVIQMHFRTDVPNTCRTEIQGFVYASRWDAGGVNNNPEFWKPLTLPLGWTQFQPCSYRLGPDGFVSLRGLGVAPGAIGFGAVVATLPVGYRPAQLAYYPVPYDGAAGIGRAIVRTNGNIELYDAASSVPDFGSIRFGVAGLL